MHVLYQDQIVTTKFLVWHIVYWETLWWAHAGSFRGPWLDTKLGAPHRGIFLWGSVGCLVRGPRLIHREFCNDCSILEHDSEQKQIQRDIFPETLCFPLAANLFLTKPFSSQERFEQLHWNFAWLLYDTKVHFEKKCYF